MLLRLGVIDGGHGQGLSHLHGNYLSSAQKILESRHGGDKLWTSGRPSLLAQLQKTFGVKTNAAVIRKVLALANVASRQADADNAITIVSDDPVKKPVKVSLDG